MNIFEVLNQGNSSLHEPSVSAMLGYLLDTRRDHGLGDTFFREFLRLVDAQVEGNRFDQVLSKSFIDTDIVLEEPYEFQGSTKKIDIQSSILDRNQEGNSEELHRIIIENKLKVSSASAGQLESYYQAVTNDEEIDDLTIVYLTPESDSSIFQSEFHELELNKSTHSKSWLRWDNEDNGIIKTLKEIFVKESSGEINPINEYTRHTIKAFIKFLRETISSGSQGTYRFGEDIGEIVEEITVSLDGEDHEYKIVKRDSQQIQVFRNGEKISAKPKLREIIKKRELSVPLDGINTRTMGRKVINELKSK